MRSYNAGLTFLVGGVALVIVLALGMVGLALLRAGQRPNPLDQPALQREAQEVFAVGTADSSVDAFADEAGVRETLDRFAAVLAGKMTFAEADLYDVDRLVEEVQHHRGSVRLNARDRRAFADGFMRGLSRSAADRAQFPPWVKYDIARIVDLGNNEIIVYFRSRNEAGYTQKVRWWLRRRDGRWRIYDIEDLDGGLRISALGASVLGQGGAANAWVNQLRNVTAAMALLQQGELDEAENQLRAADGARFPPSVEALRNAAWASLHLNRNEPKLALERCSAALAAADLPLVHWLQMVAHNQLGEYEQTLHAGSRYADLLGIDADLAAEMGYALKELGRTTEAAGVHRNGLRDNPDVAANYWCLAAVLEKEQYPELATHFARCERPREVFAEVAAQLHQSGLDDALDVLCSAYAPKANGDVELEYYRAAVHSSRGEHRQAMQVLVAAIPQAPADEVLAYTYAMLLAAYEADAPLEGYRAAPDAEYAFHQLAGMLVVDKDRSGLRELMALHRSIEPDDPWLSYYSAKERELAEDVMGADAAYAEAMASADQDVRASARYARLVARHGRGDIEGAYREIGPPGEAFADLAWLCVQHDQADRLVALLALHSAAGAPGSTPVEMSVWDAQAKFMRQDYRAAIEAAKKLLALDADEVADIEIESGINLENILVRALVRSGEHEQLARYVGSRAAEMDPLLLAVSRASAGDVAGTDAAIKAALGLWHDLEDLYADDDLGPLLRSEAMKDLRAAYPAPPSQAD